MIHTDPDQLDALDHLEHLARESARFLEVLRDVPGDLPVPSCPDWNAEDLLRHLGGVQWFWATVVRDHLSGPEVEQLPEPCPAGRAELEDFVQRSSHELHRVLVQTPPHSPAWSWSAEQTAGFSRRRQAHEALIHRVDAELVTGRRTPMDPVLGADGVDEALRIMYGGVPDWGQFAPRAGRTVRVRALDTGHSWLVTLGRFTGTDPDGGQAYDEPDIGIAEDDDSAPAAATLSGPAADLDLWLWHRPPVEPLQRAGDEQVLAEFQATIATGIN